MQQRSNSADDVELTNFRKTESKPKEIKPVLNTAQINNFITNIRDIRSLIVDVEDIGKELNRYPKKEYKDINGNPSLLNTTNQAAAKTPYSIWLQVYKYLDIRSVTTVMCSARNLRMVANNDGFRETLFNERIGSFFLKVPKPVPQFNFDPINLNNAPNLIVDHIEQRPNLYNSNNGDGTGFTMR